MTSKQILLIVKKFARKKSLVRTGKQIEHRKGGWEESIFLRGPPPVLENEGPLIMSQL